MSSWSFSEVCHLVFVPGRVYIKYLHPQTGTVLQDPGQSDDNHNNPTYGWDFSVVFVVSCSRMYCCELASPQLSIPA